MLVPSAPHPRHLPATGSLCARLFERSIMSAPQSQHSGGSPVAIETPACPKCLGSMMLSRIRPGRLNFDARTFECVKCSHVEKILSASNPIQSDLLGCLFLDLT